MTDELEQAFILFTTQHNQSDIAIKIKKRFWLFQWLKCTT